MMNNHTFLVLARKHATSAPGNLHFTEEAFLAFCDDLLAAAGVTERPGPPPPYEERHLDAATGQWKPWQVSTAERYDALNVEDAIEFRLRPRLDRTYSHESRVKGTRFAWLPVSQETFLMQKHSSRFDFREFTGYATGSA